MSNTNQMTYQDAYDLLVTNVYAPVFFHKLATDYGINASTEDEAREFLALAGKLGRLNEVAEVKQASERASFVSQASSSIDRLLGDVGLAQPNPQVENEIKQAAAELAANPYIRNAALLYQDCMQQNR